MSDYISGKYYVGKSTKDIRAVEDALTQAFLKKPQISDEAVQREWNDKIETLSEGKNVVIFDEKGFPSIYYKMPVRTQNQVVKNGVNNVFESWIVDNAIISELYVAKYLASSATDGSTQYPVSLRGRDPWCNINFDNAVAACSRKGTGHALNTNANYMQLVLDELTNSGFQAHGNTNYCKYYYDGDEHAEASYIYNNQAGRSKTGTGPNTWSHDGTPYGVFDMVGDVWEWTGGLRTVTKGLINVLPNNDAMNSANSMASSSDKWKYISDTGSYIDGTDTSNALCYKVRPDGIELTTYGSTGSSGYKDVDFKNIIENVVPNIAIRLGLYPINQSVQGHFWLNSDQEDLSLRGGDFTYTSDAGAFALSLGNARARSDFNIGFRSAFYRK